MWWLIGVGFAASFCANKVIYKRQLTKRTLLIKPCIITLRNDVMDFLKNTKSVYLKQVSSSFTSFNTYIVLTTACGVFIVKQ